MRGEMQLVTHPEKSPAVDFLTRSGQGPFVDTGVDVILRSQPGNPVQTERVYLSVATIAQLAQLAGLAGAGGSSARDEQIRAEGKLEGLNEGLGDGIADVARTLDRWLDAAGVSRGRLVRS